MWWGERQETGLASEAALTALSSPALLLLLLSRFSRVRLRATPETAAHQAPPSLGFSRQEHWSGLPFPSPGDLPDPEAEPAFLVFLALTGRFFTIVLPGKPIYVCVCVYIKN